jgi:hypothetical protein
MCRQARAYAVVTFLQESKHMHVLTDSAVLISVLITPMLLPPVSATFLQPCASHAACTRPARLWIT